MASELAPGTIVAGKYKVSERLAQGGMGAVFLAENLDLGKKVAIKVLLPDALADDNAVARFRREARAAASVGHPSIVDVIDLGNLDDGAPFIVMEWLDGQTLRARIDQATWLPVGEAARIGARVLEAVGAAHDKGIVHRDLKPDNIFLVERPERAVKVLDFGVSRICTDQTLSRTGEVMGTPLYMAPEQARGDKDVGPPADLYAIGAVLFHALVGAPPLGGRTMVEVLAKTMSVIAPRVRKVRADVPAELDGLVAELLAKEPGHRPAAREAAQRLAAIAQAAGEAPAPPPPPAKVATRARARSPEAITRALRPSPPGGARVSATHKTSTPAEMEADTIAVPALGTPRASLPDIADVADGGADTAPAASLAATMLPGTPPGPDDGKERPVSTSGEIATSTRLPPVIMAKGTIKQRASTAGGTSVPAASGSALKWIIVVALVVIAAAAVVILKKH